MAKIVDNLSEAGLFAAQEANMAAFWLVYGRARGCACGADPAFAWFYTGVPHPLFNGVVSARLSAGNVAAAVETLADHIKSAGAPALWWVGPQSRPEDLGARLGQRGLQAAGTVPVMAANLDALPEADPPIAGFVIRPVADNADDRALWARIAAIGTGLSKGATDALSKLEATLSDAGYGAQRRYVGYLDGKPVATASLVLEAGVAGVYAVATVEAARRKGIGSAMTAGPFREARDMGYRVGILQASSMGYPIYRKLGFADIGAYALYLQAG